jgi:hypothetical protein
MELFCKVRVEDSTRQTNTSNKTGNPKFKEEFEFTVLDSSKKKQSLFIRVYDQAVIYYIYKLFSPLQNNLYQKFKFLFLL